MIRLHGNGFVQADIGSRARLHVWDEKIKGLGLGQTIETLIHDHRFGFTSTVILGAIRHTVFEVQAGDQYHIWFAVPNDKEDTRLVRTGFPCNLEIVESRVVTAGETYEFESKRAHMTESLNPISATIMTKMYVETQHVPRVFIPSNLEPDNVFNRYQVDPELLRETARRALSAAGGAWI